MYHYKIKPTKRWVGCLSKPLTIAIILVLSSLACIISIVPSVLISLADAPPSNPIVTQAEPATPKPAPTRNIAQLIANATKLDYDTLARNTEFFIDRVVEYQGKVIQVEEGHMSYTMLVNVTYSDGFWDDTILVICQPCDHRILEDDNLFFIGQVDGRFTYETVLGASRTVPQISILSYSVQ